MYGGRNVNDYLSFLQSSWSKVVDNFSSSAIFATITTAALDYTGADKEALLLWIVFSTADCMLGIFRAVVWHDFDSHKLYRWTWKIGTQLAVIVLFVMMARLVHIASGKELLLTNWLLCFFAFFDFSACLDKLISLNCPVPQPLLKLLAFFRKIFSRRLADAVNATEEETKMLEHALKPEAPKRRRKTDKTKEKPE